MIYFRCTLIADLLYLDFRGGDAIEFDLGDAGRLRIEPEDTDDPSHGQMFCRLSCAKDPPARAVKVFDALARDVVPEGCQLAADDLHLRAGDRLEGGFPPPMRVMPAPFKFFVEAVTGTLHDEALRMLRLLRWRFGIDQSHNPVKATLGWAWSSDEANWRALPSDITARMSTHGFWRPEPEAMAILQELFNARRDEPMAHSLLREAREQLEDGNIRSALVVGVAAVEIGLKHCIATIAPDTEYLMREIPQPPVTKLLVDYLPTLRLAASAGRHKLKSQVIETVRKAVQMRNSTVHGNRSTIDFERVGDILGLAERLLSYFDACCGEEWALSACQDLFDAA